MHQSAGNLPWVVSILGLALVAWYAARGWRMGCIRSVVWIGGFAVALYSGARFAPSLAAALGTGLPAPARYGIAFVAIVLVVLIAADLSAIGLDRLVSFAPLSLANKAAGAVLGVVKGMVLVAVAGSVLALLPLPSDYARAYSRSGVVQVSSEVGGYLLRAIEPYVAGPIKTFLDAARTALQEKTRSLPTPLQGTPLHPRL